MDWTPNRQDTLQLHRILDQANKNFLKESSFNSQTKFNILRVLSAFRLLHPDSPPNLYNAIIYLTKIYNPQSLAEWQRAVNELSKVKPQKQKNKVTLNQTSKYMKTYQNSYNYERINHSHFQSKSYAQIKIPPEVSYSQQGSFDDINKDVSQTNIQTGKRQYYTKADSNVYNSKNHYISFEPYHQISGMYPHSYQEKENVNSTNIGESRKGESAIQYIEAIRRDLSKIDGQSLNKTPIDQSFIKKIDSYQSPYLNSIEPIDPEEEEMNERSKQFLEINLKFKAFSSLIANTLVLQKAKEHRLKAEMQNKGVLLQKSFLSLRQNAINQQNWRILEEKADKHHEKKLQTNVFSIFKLIFDLRTKITPINVSKLNRINYQFVLSLLLSVQSYESSQISVDFNFKLNELIQNQEMDKVYLILKYFGKHNWIPQHSIQALLDAYKKEILKKSFATLNLQKNENQRYWIFREKTLKKLSFGALKKKWTVSRLNKLKIMEAEGKRNRSLMVKVIKGLLQIVYSTKLYSKRCDYLIKKHNSTVKYNYLDLWNRSTKQKKRTFQILKQKAKLAVVPLTIFLLKIGFRTLVEENNNLSLKETELVTFLKRGKNHLLIDLLKTIKVRQKEQLLLQQKGKMIAYSIVLSRWKQSTRKGKAFKKMVKTIKNYAFRVHIIPELKLSIQSFNAIEQNQMKIKRNIFTTFLNWKLSQTAMFNDLIQQTQKVQEKHQKQFFISFLFSNYKYEKELLKKKQIETSQNILLSLLQQQNKKIVLQNLKQKKEEAIFKKEQNYSLEKIKLKSSLERFKVNYINQREFTLNKIKLQQMNASVRAYELNRCIKQSIFERKCVKLMDLRKKNGLFLISETASLQSRTNKINIDKSTNHNNRMLSKSVFKGLAQLIEQKRCLQQLIAKSQKQKQRKLCSLMLIQLKNETKIKRRNQIISKKIVLSELEKNKTFFSKQLNLDQTIFSKHFNLFLANLRILHSTKIQQDEEGRINTLYKYMFMNQMKKMYVMSLMQKKYLFMAFKFRALKICRKVFNYWKKHEKSLPIQIKTHKEQTRKANERLSTDFL